MDILKYSVTTVDKLPDTGEANRVYLLLSNGSVSIPDGFIWKNGKYERINIEEL